jgi:hypothetical protein
MGAINSSGAFTEWDIFFPVIGNWLVFLVGAGGLAGYMLSRAVLAAAQGPLKKQ